MNPIDLFESWFAEHKEMCNLKLPAACCLSTIGLDGFPNARYVSLKEVDDGAFVITGPSDSRKGMEMSNCPKVAITFWWSATGRQVRIQGNATLIPNSKAKVYFDQRNRESKIVSSIFQQGAEIESIESLQTQFEERKSSFGEKEISRPPNWGGVYIHPERMEFMQFRESRLHERSMYIKVEDRWKVKIIQP